MSLKTESKFKGHVTYWKSICEPCISTHAFPLDGELDFYLKMIYWLRKWLGDVTYFVLFLKGKQNKKENFKCDSLFGKGDLRKTESSSRVNLLIRKVK